MKTLQERAAELKARNTAIAAATKGEREDVALAWGGVRDALNGAPEGLLAARKAFDAACDALETAQARWTADNS